MNELDEIMGQSTTPQTIPEPNGDIERDTPTFASRQRVIANALAYGEDILEGFAFLLNNGHQDKDTATEAARESFDEHLRGVGLEPEQLDYSLAMTRFERMLAQEGEQA